MDVDEQSGAFQFGYWAGPPIVMVLAIGLLVWGAVALRRRERGLVRITVGAVVLGLAMLGYLVNVGAAVFQADTTATASELSKPRKAEPTPTPEPTAKATPDKPFKPRKVPDPGKARVYGDCDTAYDAYVATRHEAFVRARKGWVDGALTAVLASTRLVVANARCFEPEGVKDARELTYKDLNEIPKGIQDQRPECWQVMTDAYRLVGFAAGLATATDGAIDIRAGIDALHRKYPECLTEKDVADIQEVLRERFNTES